MSFCPRDQQWRHTPGVGLGKTSAWTPDPGEGYRLLDPHEPIEEGDEFYDDMIRQWERSGKRPGGQQCYSWKYRRKIPAPVDPFAEDIAGFRKLLEWKAEAPDRTIEVSLGGTFSEAVISERARYRTLRTHRSRFGGKLSDVAEEAINAHPKPPEPFKITGPGKYQHLKGGTAQVAGTAETSHGRCWIGFDTFGNYRMWDDFGKALDGPLPYSIHSRIS